MAYFVTKLFFLSFSISNFSYFLLLFNTFLLYFFLPFNILITLLLPCCLVSFVYLLRSSCIYSLLVHCSECSQHKHVYARVFAHDDSGQYFCIIYYHGAVLQVSCSSQNSRPVSQVSLPALAVLPRQYLPQCLQNLILK